MNRIIAPKRWIRILESVVLGLMGVVLIIWPGQIYAYIGLVLGIFLILYGGLYLFIEFFNKHFRDTLVGIIVAGSYLAIGIALVSIPKEIVQTIVGFLISILILAQGLSTIAQAVYERRFRDYWVLKLIVGIFILGVGVLGVVNARESSEVFLILIGGVLVFMSISQLFSTLFLLRNEPRKDKERKKNNPDIIDAEIIDEKKEK